jgi:hypothetical protein
MLAGVQVIGFLFVIFLLFWLKVHFSTSSKAMSLLKAFEQSRTRTANAG